MKKLSLWLGIGFVSLLSACSSYRPLWQLPPVGPAPGAAGYTVPGNGSLVVYSAWSCFNNYLTKDHSGYMVYSVDGKLVKWVPNLIEGDYAAEPPTRVSLPSGTYKVKALGGIYGWVMVPIVIKEGKTTPIYLDGERHSIDSVASQKNVVKLPDGEIVGWAANPAQT
jgi:hypothetical protein